MNIKGTVIILQRYVHGGYTHGAYRRRHPRYVHGAHITAAVDKLKSDAEDSIK